jgi:signal transduction histidine kinase
MEKEVSCINTRAIFDFIKEHNNDDCSRLLGQIDPEIDVLPDPESFFRDPNNWISCDVAAKLYERARLILNDEMAAYRIAKYAVEKTDLGFTSLVVKVLWSYKTALKHAQRINDKWNRNKRVELVEIKRNGAMVRLHWNPKMQAIKDFGLMNQGVYTHMPLIWGGNPLVLKEEYCYFEGGRYCEFHLKWPARNRFREILSRFFTSKSVFMETIKEMEKDKDIIEQKYQEIDCLNVKLDYKIKQLLGIQETGKAILSVLDLDQLLTAIMNSLSNVCRIHRAIIMLVNEKEGYLEYTHSVGFHDGVPEEVKNYTVSLTRTSNILVRVANTGRSEYIPEVESSQLRKENILLTHGKPTSVYVAPLITGSKLIGVIATDAVDNEGIQDETRETLDIFAPQIAIAIQNARLYRRLEEQMRELKRSHALLSRVEKFSFLGNLAARLAHEIKNPMTAIGTFIQLLPMKYDDEEFRRDFHKIAAEETARVNNLITELLDLVKPRESKFEFSDLNGLIDKMILLISPQSHAKKIDIIRQFDPENPQVWMDAEKMKQVFLNLLSNALEFTPEGGRIEILTRDLTERGKQKSIRIEIKDNGVGIPQSMIDKIFDPYFTTKHKSQMHSGTGLGLFIAHQNMGDHGGTIEVKSNRNEGTLFILTLPADPPSRASDMAEKQNYANRAD